MLGIRDYRPRPVTTVRDLVARHGDRLHSLVGRRLDTAWGLCFVCDGEWCSTGPLVLDFGGERLEVVAEGFDRLCVTWNEIDLAETPDDDYQDDPDLAMEWSRIQRPELARVLGRAVGGLTVLENDFRFEAVDGRRVEAWLLAGLEFVFDRGGHALQVYNVLNELGLAAEDPRSGSWRRTELPTGRPPG